MYCPCERNLRNYLETSWKLKPIGGFNPVKQYESTWIISPGTGVNMFSKIETKPTKPIGPCHFSCPKSPPSKNCPKNLGPQRDLPNFPSSPREIDPKSLGPIVVAKRPTSIRNTGDTDPTLQMDGKRMPLSKHLRFYTQICWRILVEILQLWQWIL